MRFGSLCWHQARPFYCSLIPPYSRLSTKPRSPQLHSLLSDWLISGIMKASFVLVIPVGETSLFIGYVYRQSLVAFHLCGPPNQPHSDWLISGIWKYTGSPSTLLCHGFQVWHRGHSESRGLWFFQRERKWKSSIGKRFFSHRRIVSAVKRVEFVSYRLSYTECTRWKDQYCGRS